MSARARQRVLTNAHPAGETKRPRINRKDATSMRQWLAATALVFLAEGAAAQGRPVADLAAHEVRALAALGAGYIARAEPDRLILTCPGCEGAPMVEVRLGRQEDGTEGRVRSGATTITSLDQQCRARNPTCRVERADIGPAVGWISTYRAGEVAGTTLVLLRDGALVTVRSMASSPEVARRNVDRLRAEVVPALVGR